MKHINVAKLIAGVILLVGLGALLPFKFAGPFSITLGLSVIFIGVVLPMLLGKRESINNGAIKKADFAVTINRDTDVWPVAPGVGKPSHPWHGELVRQLNDTDPNRAN